jgi:DNA-binding response OmpR family regulator
MEDLNIIYAEDDALLAQTTTKIFKRFFNEVHQFYNGQEALEYYKNNDGVDLIITDISMPVLNGIDFISEIRKQDSEVPIIAVTAHKVEFEDKLKELDAKLLTKPVDIKVLLDNISFLTNTKNPLDKLIITKVDQ